jgi:arylesterase / paraoxonase
VSKTIWWVALGLVTLLGVLLLDTLHSAGELTSLTPRPLHCRSVPGLVGPEDITVDRARDVAYISATDARAIMKKQTAFGALYRYAVGDDTPTQLYTADRFHPHGIGYFSDGAAPDLLYVVNHESDTSHSIEVFEVTDSGLRHAQTLRDPALVSPNDVVAIRRGELYVTNDHGVGRGPGQLFDDFSRRARGQILHLKDGKFRVLASDLAYANGINAKGDGSELYVAESTGRRLRIYTRDAASGSITLRQTLDLGTGADNIELAPDGSLYVGAHPKLLTFFRHASDARMPSPSEVLRVTGGKVEQVFLDLGDQLSASTVGAPYRDRLLIGSVFADHFLDCKLP